MRIVHLNTGDISGGASRAAYRLHKGLCERGENSRMLVLDKRSSDSSVLQLNPRKSKEQAVKEFYLRVAIQHHYINSRRSGLSNTMFSLPYPGYDLSQTNIIHDAHIINLHWIAYYQSPMSLNKIFCLGKPVVWTLHDQWPFTGGCHYSGGCDRYKNMCSDCPQLSDDPNGLVPSVFKDKLQLFAGANLTIVTPSRWMAKCARQSKLFGDLRIEVIQNSVKTNLFIPLKKAKAKESIGISPECLTVLFGAEFGTEKRKGFPQLVEALNFLLEEPKIQDLVKNDKLRILSFGYPNDEFHSFGIPAVILGYIDSDYQLANAYSAADIYVLPSLEDNFPNTILEAMSCETPVIAFNAGGIPDMVVDGVTGRLAPLRDTRKMGQAIFDLLLNVNQRELMGRNCRQIVEENCSLAEQSRSYLKLYEELLRDSRSTNRSSHRKVFRKAKHQVLSDPLRVNIETSLGPHFHDIYEEILATVKKRLCFVKEGSCQQIAVWGPRWAKHVSNLTRLIGFVLLKSPLLGCVLLRLWPVIERRLDIILGKKRS